MDCQKFFKDKKITLMGLGLLGRGVGDAEFLAENGAQLTITDLKSAEELRPSLDRLKKFENIKYRLGGHDVQDFKAADFILKAAGVPLDSPFIAEARKNKIPIEMDASLFYKLAPKHHFIGVTGTRGKSTTTFLLYEILKTAGKQVFIAGNVKDTATLPLLNEVKSGDYVVAELDSWQLQGFGESRMSPPYAVFTTFLPDHLNYYNGDMNAYFSDKEFIYKYQKKEDVLVVGEDIEAKIKRAPGTMLVARRADVSVKNEYLPGEHNKLNIACALAVAKVLGVDSEASRKAVEGFAGVEGRLQFVADRKGVKIYNDTTATTPDATIAALKTLDNGNTILIGGGADKNLPLDELVQEINARCKAFISLSGSGTDRLIDALTASESALQPFGPYDSLERAVTEAFTLAKRGDLVLFSPGFASFGMFKNEYDRGEQFTALIKKLK